MPKPKHIVIAACFASLSIFAATSFAAGTSGRSVVDAELFGPGFDCAAWLSKTSKTEEIKRLGEAFEYCASNAVLPALDFSAPFELYPDGRKKNQISARKAQLFPEKNLIWAEDVVLEQFARDGKLEARLTADSCVIDRKTKTGWVRGNAKLVYGDNTVSGNGIFFSTDDEFIKITENSCVKAKGIFGDWKKML